MEEGVRKELDEIKGMVLAWKESYLGLAASDGADESMTQDFLEEIESHVHPYVMRMYDCNYLSQSEVAEFLRFCHEQVEALRVSMRDAEAEHPETIWPEGREKETFSPH